MEIEGIDRIKENISNIVEARRMATIALCAFFAEKAKQIFRERQVVGKYWNNQTGSAFNQVFAEEYVDGDEAGWFIAHAVEYGVYLELANNRKNESLRPIVEELFPEFQKALEEIWGD